MAFRSFTRPSTVRRSSFLPRLEALEERWVPSAGDYDLSFNGTGSATYDLGGYNRPHDVVVQTDGKIVLAGHTGIGATDFVLERFNANGSIDTSFGSGGSVVTDYKNKGDSAYAVAIQSDGKIVAAGSATNAAGTDTDFALARYNANGTLDMAFGGSKNKGKFTTDIGGQDIIRNMVILADGKILVAGQTNDAQNKIHIALARYTTSGSLDTTFGTGGKVITTVIITSAPATERPFGMALQSDGRIVIATTSDVAGGAIGFLVARFNANGSVDTSFGSGGQVTNNFITGFTDGAVAIAVQSDGKIVAGGTTGTDGGLTDPHPALARYNANGSLDTSFGSGGFVNTTGVIGEVSDLVLQADGKIVVGGEWFVGRYNTNGTVDTSFAPTSATPGFVRAFTLGIVGSSLTLQSDGKIVAAGNTGTGNDNDFVVARFLNDSLPAGPAPAPATAATAGRATDAFFADLRAVSILLSIEDARKR